MPGWSHLHSPLKTLESYNGIPEQIRLRAGSNDRMRASGRVGCSHKSNRRETVSSGPLVEDRTEKGAAPFTKFVETDPQTKEVRYRMKLGTPELSLNVADLAKSLSFYQALGFTAIEGKESEGWLVIQQDGIRIGLYAENVAPNSLTFFGGDVEAIARKLHEAGVALESDPTEEADGTMGAKVLDPDGNLIYFNS